MAWGSIFNPVLSTDDTLGAFKDGALADPLPVLGKVVKDKRVAAQKAVQDGTTNLNAPDPYASGAAQSVYMTDAARVEKLRKFALDKLDQPDGRGSLELVTQVEGSRFQNGDAVLQSVVGADGTRKRLSREEMADAYVSMQTANKEQKWYKEYEKNRITTKGDLTSTDKTTLAYTVYERNALYQKALQEKGIDEVSRQEIANMYLAGETSTTLATKLNDAKGKKGEYALRSIAQSEQGLQKSPGFQRPRRAGVL